MKITKTAALLRCPLHLGAAAAFFLVLITPPGKTTNIPDQLTVGPAGMNPSVASPTSAAIGSEHQIPSTSLRCLSVGYGNSVMNDMDSIVAGNYNGTNYSCASGVFGQENSTNLAYYSLTAGSFNSASSTGVMVFGFGNQAGPYAHCSLVGGTNNIAHGLYSGVFGHQATAYSSNNLVVGQYNAPVNSEENGSLSPNPRTSWRSGDSLFVVGNGASNTQRNNAFLVKKDGTITMQRQGDISMGSFTVQ